ncbi:hypothetical protein PV08_04422 [Exophiala spinifera]|uniref:Ubiquitin 3 binding protein But2 C-terminal domain-containing protein n=1 Tax=Exophiala spinifera TaxID=91928 RepID=A0A0D1YPT2_9EURO|nr:uncharacterized protein PV08_04422 [Exophiala spinifera]KIW17231.1 hypothetical protein PV08_04422 [Exophiala spinifera]
MVQSSVIAIILGGILSSKMLSQAAPLGVRQDSSTASGSSGSPWASAPYTGYPSGAAYVAQVYPDYTSQYNVKTGAVDFNTALGLVSRSYTNGGADTTALVTFTVAQQFAQNWCQLVFDLADPSSYATGSLKAQLFTSLAPATADTTTWPSGNLRNQNIGAIDVVPGGVAQWQVGSGPAATSNGFFPCSSIAGQPFAGEVVPQGDQVEISWPAGTDGIKILVY